MATIKDIAKAAGVSQGTVSNVLSGKDNVSSDKIQRVMRIVEEMGYYVNEKARNLRKGATKVFAVVVPDLYNKAYIDFFTNFKEYAEQNDYIVDLYITNDDPDNERDIIRRIRSGMTEGVAVFTSIFDSSEPYFEAGFSKDDVIFIDRHPFYECKYIGYDNKRAGREIAERVVNGGYRKIAILTSPLTYSYKKDFYNSLMEQINNSKKIKEVYEGTTTEQCKYQSIANIFSNMKPDAIITDCISLAQAVQDVYGNFFRDISMDIFSLASVYTIPEMNIIKYEVDYRSMGTEAASYLTKRNWNDKDEIVIKSKGLSDRNRKKVKSKNKILNILSIGSPTTAALKTLANLYEYNTGITVYIKELSSEDMYELIKSKKAELFYDIIRMDKDWFPWFAKSVFEPLTNIDSNIANKLDGYLPNVLDEYSYLDGEIYALPGSQSVQLLFYRKDLFEDLIVKRLYYEMYKKPLTVPKTFEEYNSIAHFFTKKFNDKSPVRYGCTFALGEPALVGIEFLIRYFSHTKKLFDKSGDILLDTEFAKKALKETEDSWEFSSKVEHDWWTDTASEFAKGDTAMSINMINHANIFVGANSNIIGKIGWDSVPGNNPMIGGSVLGISKYSKYKEEALDFLKWLSRDDVGTITALLGGMPARKIAYDEKEVNNSYPWLNYAKKCFEKSKVCDYHTAYEYNIELKELQNVIGNAVRDGILGKIDMGHVLRTAKVSYEKIKNKE